MRDPFRQLKRSLEAALKAMSPASELEQAGRFPSPASEHEHADRFPSPPFVTCMLLVALKVLQARNKLKHLHTECEHLHTDLSSLLLSLHERVESVCSNDARINCTLVLPLNAPEALKLLETVPQHLWLSDATIGYAYQFLCMAARKSAQKNIQTANKNLLHEDLIAFTQLYTPDWVVEFLVCNTLSAQVDNGDAPKRKLALPLSECTDSNVIASDLANIIDPACGAGNFLVTAYDVLINLHTMHGYEPAKSINKAQNQIFGADLDASALWVTCLALTVKALQYSASTLTGKFSIVQAAEKDKSQLLGSLSKDFHAEHPLAHSYNVALMNPPYVGRKLMSRQLKFSLKEHYPTSHADISAAFIERALELLQPGGRLGVITQASLLSLPSYSAMRAKLLTQNHLIACVDAGAGVFPLQGGDKVSSAILVIEKSTPLKDSKSFFFNLRSSADKRHELEKQIKLLFEGQPGNYFVHAQSSFLQEEYTAIKYGCPETILHILRGAKKLQDIAEIRQGLATTDNARFVKRIEELAPGELHTEWVPYVKGAGADRWFSPVLHAVKWGNSGQEIKDAVSKSYPYLKGNTKWVVKNEQFYFRPGLCFSFVNTGNLAVRRLPQGCIFDVGASAVFPDENIDQDFLLAYLNSNLVSAIARSINPTINFQVGDVKRLPIFAFNSEQEELLGKLALKCVSISESLKSNPIQPEAAILKEHLCQIENQINEIVFNSFCQQNELTESERGEIDLWIKATTSASSPHERHSPSNTQSDGIDCRKNPIINITAPT